VNVVEENATTRQQVIFAMLAMGMQQNEIAEHLNVGNAVVSTEKVEIATMLKAKLELNIRNEAYRKPDDKGIPGPTPKQPVGQPAPEQPSMKRVKSPLGAEIAAAIKGGAAVVPTGGGYSGPVMTITLPASELPRRRPR
jgi:hypothetical protein